MARIQRFTSHRGGAYVWLPPEFRRRLGLIKGDHLLLEFGQGESIVIHRFSEEAIRAVTGRNTPPVSNQRTPAARPQPA